MSDIDWLKIVRWGFIVLVAGFIGQFGKMLANHFATKAKLKKGETPQISEGTPDEIVDKQASPSPVEPSKDKAKGEKKLLKTLAKHKKKEAKTLQKKNEP